MCSSVFNQVDSQRLLSPPWIELETRLGHHDQTTTVTMQIARVMQSQQQVVTMTKLSLWAATFPSQETTCQFHRADGHHQHHRDRAAIRMRALASRSSVDHRYRQ